MKKITQTQWLKATEIHCFVVPEQRSKKSRCWHGCYLLEALGENPFSVSLLVSGGGWQFLVFLDL